MKVKRLAFPLAEDRAVLQDKWWHRLFVVLFVICVFIFLIISILYVSFIMRDSNYFGIVINDNLHRFSAQSDKSIPNTIPHFLKLGGKLGCLKDNGEVYSLSPDTLGKTSYCKANFIIYEKSDFILYEEELIKSMQAEEERTGVKKDILDVILPGGTYCFISDDVACIATKIVMYRLDIVFYLKIALYSCIATYTFSLFLQFLYFKGLIYIIYGRNVKPKMP